MTQHPIDAWHALVRSHDPRGLDALLADDAVFISPVVHTPQRGKAVTRAYLSAAFQVFINPTFRYWGADGRIAEFKVLVRPLKAIQLIHQRMAALLAAAARPA